MKRTDEWDRIKDAIRRKYTSIGCYPLFLITADGAALCINCGKSEYRELVRARLDNDRRGGWYVEAADVNWEDTSLYCDHCNDAIESAYGETDNV